MYKWVKWGEDRSGKERKTLEGGKITKREELKYNKWYIIYFKIKQEIRGQIDTFHTQSWHSLLLPINRLTSGMFHTCILIALFNSKFFCCPLSQYFWNLLLHQIQNMDYLYFFRTYEVDEVNIKNTILYCFQFTVDHMCMDNAIKVKLNVLHLFGYQNFFDKTQNCRFRKIVYNIVMWFLENKYITCKCKC